MRETTLDGSAISKLNLVKLHPKKFFNDSKFT